MTTTVRIAQEVVELVVTQPVLVTVAQEVVEVVYIETVTPGHIIRTGNIPTISYEISLTPSAGHIIRTGNIPTITIDNPLIRSEYNPRCILIEIDWVDDSQVLHTEYLSNLGYTTQSTDNPADQHYADLVLQAPVITARIDSALQVVELTVRNPMQEGNAAGSVTLIDWANRSWHGHDIRLYVGDPTWPMAQFRLFFMGKVDNFSMDGDGAMTFSVVDYGLLLQDAVTKTYGIYGKVFNMQPVYVGAGSSDTYRIDDINTGVSPPQANYNVYEITQVRDNGNIVAFTASADKKQFELDIPPAGTITVDAIKSANYSAGRVITDIITDLGYSTALIDLASMNGAIPGIGYVIGQNETTSLMQIVQDISTSAGGFIQWDSKGKLRFFSIDINKAPKMDIGIDDMTAAGLQITSIDNPLFYLNLGYNRNWHVQDYSSLAGIAQIDSSPFTVEYKYLTQDNGKTVQYPLPIQQSIDTLLADESDARIEFNRRLAQRANRTINFSVELFNLLTELVLGDNVTITYPKFNINLMRCTITGITLNPNTNITNLSLWTSAEWITGNDGNDGNAWYDYFYYVGLDGQKAYMQTDQNLRLWVIDRINKTLYMPNPFTMFDSGFAFWFTTSIIRDFAIIPESDWDQYRTVQFDYVMTGNPVIVIWPTGMTFAPQTNSGTAHFNLVPSPNSPNFRIEASCYYNPIGQLYLNHGDGTFLISNISVTIRNWSDAGEDETHIYYI